MSPRFRLQRTQELFSKWNRCRASGRELWSSLIEAQQSLPERDMADSFSILDTNEMEDICTLSHMRTDTLFQRIPGSVNMCNTRFDIADNIISRKTATRPAFQFNIQLNPKYDVILSSGTDESGGLDEVEPTDPSILELICIAWSDLTFKFWRTRRLSDQQQVSGLGYIYFSLILGWESLAVFRQTLQGDSNVIIDTMSIRAQGYNVLGRYEPGSTNFNALLGTMHGAAAARMLTNHAQSFATKDTQIGAVTKVKTIREIQISARVFGPTNPGRLPLRQLFERNGISYAKMLIILDDTDPPPAAEQPTNTS